MPVAQNLLTPGRGLRNYCAFGRRIGEKSSILGLASQLRVELA